jgi:hypothetical protein
MQGSNTPKDYSDDYIETCFATWYSLGQPTNIVVLQENLPTTPEGKKPGVAMLRQFRDTHGWIERADGLNALAIGKAEVVLVDERAKMFIRQIEAALEVGKAAKEHLLENGFDTSSSAVNALRWAQEEERTVRGVSEMMVKISKMSPEELMAEAAKLLKRNSEVIEGVEIEDDANNDSSTLTD